MELKFISWNVNGLRAVVGKNFLEAFSSLSGSSGSAFLHENSGPCPLPLPNRFAKSSCSVLAVRLFTQFPIKKRSL